MPKSNQYPPAHFRSNTLCLEVNVDILLCLSIGSHSHKLLVVCRKEQQLWKRVPKARSPWGLDKLPAGFPLRSVSFTTCDKVYLPLTTTRGTGPDLLTWTTVLQQKCSALRNAVQPPLRTLDHVEAASSCSGAVSRGSSSYQQRVLGWWHPAAPPGSLLLTAPEAMRSETATTIVFAPERTQTHLLELSP